MSDETTPKVQTNQLLGFGDLQGFYDFDSMAIWHDRLSMKEHGAHSELHNRLVLSHETNHWNQQIFSTFGNFSICARSLILKMGSSVWKYLPVKYRELLISGQLPAPFPNALGNGKVSTAELEPLSTDTHSAVQMSVGFINFLRVGTQALETVGWLLEDNSVRKCIHHLGLRSS